MKLKENSRPAEILLVEDNDDDVVLTEEGFRLSKLVVNLHRVENGVECMKFLRKEEPFADSPAPDLILLDLNMPIMNGREVLAELVKDELLNHLPVVVLTTAEEHSEIMDLYKMRVSSYIRKPVNFDEFLRAIQELGSYWFTLVVLPNNGD
ncbi:MAG: CheY-like chemotaxis protein [Verrucomicrobiales bacterium]|jgi:CheY-like chemotaxis protein